MSNEIEARQTIYEGTEFTVHYLVSLAWEYDLISSRAAFYHMTEKMKKAVLKQILQVL